MQWSGYRIRRLRTVSPRSPSPRSPSKRSEVRWRLRMKVRFCFRAIGFRAGTRPRSILFGEKVSTSKDSLFSDLRPVFKKYSQMKLQMKREALEKLNRRANEMVPTAADDLMAAPSRADSPSDYPEELIEDA